MTQLYSVCVRDFWRGLQLFADGAAGDGGASGGDGATAADTGVIAADAGQQRLLDLGVPPDKIRKSRARKQPVELPNGAIRTEKPTAADGQAAAADAQTKEQSKDADGTPTQASKPSWDDIMADPDYNKQMQSVVQQRLKNAKTAADTLSKLNPIMEIMARKYNLDAAKMDYDALSKAVLEDRSFYEDRALETGRPVEEIMTNEQQRVKQTIEQQKIQNHLQSLRDQGEAMKETFPKFDLAAELKNPAFARMTSPVGGVSVEDAYYAVHRKEIQTAAMQAAASKTAQQISKSIQAGQTRPVENGASAQAPAVASFNASNMSKAQRAELKKRIYMAGARGEKVYPGQ